MGRTVPALPVRTIGEAVECYVDRFGFDCVHRDDAGFAVVRRDEAEIHLWQAGDERWRDRDAEGSPVVSGAESFLAGTASCRVEVDSVAAVDALYDELAAVGRLHPADGGAPVDTDFGTREFATLDVDGNLLTFFART